MYRILSEVVSNFSNSLDEVTLTVNSAGLKLKNYVDDLEGEFYLTYHMMCACIN